MAQKMTRAECEFKLLEKWKEMVEIYRQYNEDAEYLTASFNVRDSEKQEVCLNINDDYFNHENTGIIVNINIIDGVRINIE